MFLSNNCFITKLVNSNLQVCLYYKRTIKKRKREKSSPITGLEPTTYVIKDECLNRCGIDENILYCLTLTLPFTILYNYIYSTLILVNWTETTEVGWNI